MIGRFVQVEPDNDLDEICLRHEDGWPEVWVHRVTFGRQRLRVGWSRQTLPDWHEKWREKGIPWGYDVVRDYCFGVNRGALMVGMTAVIHAISNGVDPRDLPPNPEVRPIKMGSDTLNALVEASR